MHVTPSRDEFLRLAEDHAVVPVRLRVLGDRHTPVSAFESLAVEGPAFLLESVEGGERWARWSFVGWDPLFVLLSEGGRCRVEGPAVEIPDADPLTVLESVVRGLQVPDLAGLPPLHTGLVGYLGYDTVRYVEHLPDRPPDDRGLPEMMWQAVGSMAAIDRFAQTITLIRNVLIGDDPAAAYDAAVDDLSGMQERLGGPGVRPAPPVSRFDAPPPADTSLDREAYMAAVERSVRYIEAGDAFQIVPSVRFQVAFGGDPFAVYRALRLVNPSPFMFFLRYGSLAIAGASPELMVRVRDGTVSSRPIAGTRPRGADPEADAALEEELVADPKERAEHVMLVDLARNDVGRVAEYGTVSVDDLMVVERYSHVMHLVSGVSGTLRREASPVDVLRATFPHGTVTGAPKVRAMEIIDELEPVARGPYAGAAGYIDFSGNLDTAIALRTMVTDGTTAWVQAGAGVVADSVPASEWDECVAKAAAVLAAIGSAGEI
jgi:anthranilate synthase component 1